jgi:branched-chain amino acid aminotransferase
MFCTGTMGELAGVIKIDGRIRGDGSAGVMTKRLIELYVQRTAIEGVPVAPSSGGSP